MSSCNVRTAVGILLPNTMWTAPSPTFNILAFERARYGTTNNKSATMRLRTLPLRVQASRAVCGGVMSFHTMLHKLHLLLHGRPSGSRNNPRLWGERHKEFKEGRMKDLLMKSTLDRVEPLRARNPVATLKQSQLADAKRERVLQNWFLPAHASKKFLKPPAAYVPPKKSKAKPGVGKHKASPKGPERVKQKQKKTQPVKTATHVKRKRSVKACKAGQKKRKKENPKDQRKK